MKTILRVSLLALTITTRIAAAQAPNNLEYFFLDQAEREFMRKTFSAPEGVQVALQKIMESHAGKALIAHQRAYSLSDLRAMAQNEFAGFTNSLKEHGFNVLDISETLDVVHEALPNYVIHIELLDYDTRKSPSGVLYPIANQFQGVSRIPGTITLEQAIQAHGLEAFIGIPGIPYYYQYTLSENPQLTDFDYISFSTHVNVVDETAKKEMLKNLTELHANALKLTILAGGVWAATEHDLDFTPEGKIIISTVVQPDNTLARDFYNKSSAKVISNVIAGMTSFNDLMDAYQHENYKFTSDDLARVAVQLQMAKTLEKNSPLRSINLDA